MARRRRTSIRTAAGTTQDRFKQRIQELAADPLRVLPECPHGEPAPIAKLRSRLERVAAGKVGFLDKRAKGVWGAVVQSIPLADEPVARLLDDKVEGNRRFFLTRGQVQRLCLMGVQNHDDPRALMAAYVPMARKHGLHFFAMPRLWCTGTAPRPPAPWWDALATKTDLRLRDDGEGRSCPHMDRVRLEVTFPGGPSLRICGPCGTRSGNLLQHLDTRYAGPAAPMEVRARMPDGSALALDDKDEKAYRAGGRGGEEILEKALKAWHKQADGRYRLGDRDFADQEAFLDALGVHGWERDALAAMTKDGHAGPMDTAANIIDAHDDALVAGVQAVLGGDETDAAHFIAAHDVRPREVVRLAHEEAQRRARTADLPDPKGLGPIGSWVHGSVRAVRREGKAAGLERARKALDAGTIPPAHLYAFIHALGGSLDLEIRFRPDEKEAGTTMQPRAEALLDAAGDAYLAALRTYLRESGSGEA